MPADVISSSMAIILAEAEAWPSRLLIRIPGLPKIDTGKCDHQNFDFWSFFLSKSYCCRIFLHLFFMFFYNQFIYTYMKFDIIYVSKYKSSNDSMNDSIKCFCSTNLYTMPYCQTPKGYALFIFLQEKRE